MKKINLETIIENTEIGDEIQFDINHNGNGTTMYTRKAVLILMKEVCKQTLELVAENAKAYDPIHSWNIPVVDKKSITNTLNQII